MFKTAVKTKPNFTSEFKLTKSFIRTTVREELGALFSDPDFGLALQPAFKRRLAGVRTGNRASLIPAASVIKRLQLEV